MNLPARAAPCHSEAGTSPAAGLRLPVAWVEVECEDCGVSWRDVWTLVDVTKVCSSRDQKTER